MSIGTGADWSAGLPQATPTSGGGWQDTLAKVLGAGTGIAAIHGLLNKKDRPPMGYQGQIPEYVAERETVPGVYDPNRRPGSAGQRYFTDVEYKPKGTHQQQPRPSVDELVSLNQWANSLGSAKRTPSWQGEAQQQPAQQQPAQQQPAQQQPAQQQYTDSEVKAFIDQTVEMFGGMNEPAKKVIAEAMKQYGVTPEQVARASGHSVDSVTSAYQSFGFARGGVASLLQPQRKGYYLGGPTDGMADEVPASIEGEQDAALSHGEFVIPADVVSHLGNGNSEAGAQRLYEMMDRIRKDRTGTTEQGQEVNPANYVPR